MFVVKINEEKMKQFVDFFDKEIVPAIRGKDGEGLKHLKEIAKRRRAEVEEPTLGDSINN